MIWATNLCILLAIMLKSDIYLNTGARKTHISRICTGILIRLRAQWIVPDVTINPGYTWKYRKTFFYCWYCSLNWDKVCHCDNKSTEQTVGLFTLLCFKQAGVFKSKRVVYCFIALMPIWILMCQYKLLARCGCLITSLYLIYLIPCNTFYRIYI